MTDPTEQHRPDLVFRDREHFVEMLVAGSKASHRDIVTAQAERKLSRRQAAARVLGEALPNVIGTVIGGAVLALAAAGLGLIDDFSTTDAAVVGASVSVVLFLAVFWDPAPTPPDETRIRADAERIFDEWQALGVLKPREAPPGSAVDLD